MDKIVLIGAGGHCKVIIDIINSVGKYDIIGITDYNKDINNIYDIPVIGNDDILGNLYSEGIHNAFICIGALGDIKIRNKIYENLKSIGYNLPVLIHNKAIVSPFSYIDEGTCVMAGSIVNSGASIGKNSIINTGAIIEHDCLIGNNVHISPGAILGGNVTVQDDVHVGLGANIIQGIKIETFSTIGAGSVVINNIGKNSTVVGVPAKDIKKK